MFLVIQGTIKSIQNHCVSTIFDLIQIIASHQSRVNRRDTMVLN